MSVNGNLSTKGWAITLDVIYKIIIIVGLPVVAFFANKVLKNEQVLNQHEIKIDNLSNKVDTNGSNIKDNINKLDGKVDKIDDKVDQIQQDLARLAK